MNNKWYNSLDTIFLGLFTLIGVAFLIGQPKVYDSSLTGGKLFFVFLTILFCPVYSIILLVFFIKGKRFSRNKMIYNVLITLAILIAGFSIAYSSIDSGAVAYYTTQFHSGWDESFFKEVPVYKNELLGYAIAIIGELTFAWLLFWRKKSQILQAKRYFFPLYLFLFFIMHGYLASMRRPVERQERAKGNEQASWEKPPDNEESYKGFFTEVDKDPSFPGGEEKMYQYIKGKIDYSAFSEGYKDTGTVVVSFMVRPTGNLYRVQIKKGLNRRIDEAVIRVFQNMPKWKPGQQNGRKVNVYREVSIKFG